MCGKNEHPPLVHYLDIIDEEHICWFCKIKGRASVGSIYNPRSYGYTYYFCNECLKEILINKIGNFEKHLLTTILKCSEKDIDYLKILEDRFKEILQEKASKFLQEDLDFALETYNPKKNQVNDLIYYMLCHITENKYGKYFDEDDVWSDELIEYMDSLNSPDFSFKTTLFKEFELSPNIHEEMVNLLNKFLKI